MNKLEQLVAQLDLVNQLLFTRVSLENNAQNMHFFLQLKAVSQKVSLAEKNWQVKNTCSPISSEK
ncbi:endonuclease [Lysinibacillus sp. FSL R5-0849]|uniref:endonuclease n=1 Tax=Lysinibacillus sp. FSL R5-0849 TaxID=2921660 RepID=UPI0031599BD0